jgi:pilus assembly protein FimV
MVRKLLKVLLAGSVLLPSLGFGLGLGDIHLRSGLNQQLDAEIELLSAEPSEADKITVSLASYETFAKLGVDRPAILMLMNFEVHKRANGTPYIKVRSKELINEPFLDFLVEVTWPSGKVLREYTLLLDPPAMSAQQEPLFVQPPQVVETPPVVAPSPAALPVQEPVVSAPVDISQAPVTETQPVQVAAEQQGAPQTAPATQEQPTEEVPAVTTAEAVAALAAPAEPAAPVERTTGRFTEDKALVEPAPVSAPSEAMVYGPVKRNETLSRIANSMRPDQGVSVEQMMIALYNSNREAFIHNNINLLRKGAVLRIEDPATLRALSQAEARRQVARHGRAWEEYRSKVAASTPKSVPAEPTAEPARAGGAAAQAKEETKLTLVAPSKPGESKQTTVGGTADKGVEAESLRKELLLANETTEARRKENEELNKRLKELEGQLQQMQKLITLKDDNLAAMQQKLAEQQKAANGKPAAEPAKPVQAAPATSAQPPLVVPAPPEAKAPGAAVPNGAVPTTTTPAAEAVPATTPVEGGAAPAEDTAPAAAAQTPAAAEPTKPKKRPKPVVPPPAPEPSLIDELMGDPMVLGGGALALLLLVLGGIVLMRRRRQSSGFQESILTVGATSSMMKGKGDNPASETSFLSDLAISGMGGRVQEESDVDPLTEADVYMAYNRFPQAEELLKEGLKHNPERDELHAKLLEVYYKSRNRAAFEQLAQARAGTMRNNQGMWQKVVAMGHELAPDNALFKGAAVAGGAAMVAAAATAEPSAASDVFDIGLDLDALSSEMEAAGAAGSDFVDLGLDFSDLGMDEGAKKKPEEPVAEVSDLDFNFDLGSVPETPAEQAESPSLDFDFSAFGGEAESAPPVTSEPLQAEESAMSGLDFDLSSMAEETSVAEEPATSLDFGDFDLGNVVAEEEASFDLGSLDLGSSDTDLSAGAGGESIDFSAFDLGTTEEPAMDLADLGDFGDLGMDSSLGGMDEVGTKLDLAKAYVDMGDAEGARGMLEEVMHEGSDEQKRQAKELLSQIS